MNNVGRGKKREEGVREGAGEKKMGQRNCDSGRWGVIRFKKRKKRKVMGILAKSMKIFDTW